VANSETPSSDGEIQPSSFERSKSVSDDSGEKDGFAVRAGSGGGVCLVGFVLVLVLVAQPLEAFVVPSVVFFLSLLLAGGGLFQVRLDFSRLCVLEGFLSQLLLAEDLELLLPRLAVLVTFLSFSLL